MSTSSSSATAARWHSPCYQVSSFVLLLPGMAGAYSGREVEVQNMAKQVVGLFDTTQDAQGAVQALRDAGFSADNISVVLNNASGEFGTYDGTGTEAAEGAGA